MDNYLFKVNITWTSPFFVYTPRNQWDNGITTQNDSIAQFNFQADGIKLFGRTNATYTTQLDGTTSQPANPRWFNYTTGEVPSNVACDDTTPWGCMVMAEYHDLNPATNHTFTLQSKFNSTFPEGNVSLLAMQVIHDTGLSNRTVAQMNEVDMEDSRLVYRGDWENIAYDPAQYRISRTPGSTITFPFSGYAIYVWGTTDLFESQFSVSLDGKTHDMPAPSSGYKDVYCLLWYQAGLDQNNRHTLVVNNTQSNGLIIRGFTVVRLVDPSRPGQSLQPETPGQSSHPENQSGTPPLNRLSTGPIVAIVGGVVMVLVFVGVALFLLRRRRKSHVEAEKDAHASIPSVQRLMGSNTPSSNRFGEVTPWEGPITPISGQVQTPQSSAPPLTPGYPPSRAYDATSPSSTSSGKPSIPYGATFPIAGSSRDGSVARPYMPTNAQSPMSPGTSSSRNQYQQPGASLYAMEYHKPPLNLGEPSSSSGTPVTDRRVDYFVTSPGSSSHGLSGSERGPVSAGGSRQELLGSETTQSDGVGTQVYSDRSATPPPAYEYRAQPRSSSSAPNEDPQDRERRRQEERQRRRDVKTASASGSARGFDE